MSVSQWEEYLKAFHERQRIEEYQKNRMLPRPKTTKSTVAIYVITLFATTAIGLTVLFTVPFLTLWARIFLSILCIALIAESYCRMVAIKVVECYQHYAKEETRRKCKCIPSCSEYAILCLKKYELIYALRKIRKRLFVTCRGFDYIVDNP